MPGPAISPIPDAASPNPMYFSMFSGNFKVIREKHAVYTHAIPIPSMKRQTMMIQKN